MSFCGSSTGGTSTQNNQWVDPLGPTSINANGSGNYSATGAPQMRSNMFDYLNSQTPQLQQAGQAAGQAAQTAAANPGYAAAAAQANQNIAGDYLAGSPQLNAAMAQNTAQQMGSAANTNARTQSQYAMNGMNYSTANQQAAQANMGAAAASAANTNAQTFLSNYQAERANQNNGATQLNTATSAPLSYLNQVSSSETAPEQQIGNIISGLSSGGQVANGGGTQAMSDNPSTGSDIMNGMSVLGDL
jgi:hypothetical protein